MNITVIKTKPIILGDDLITTLDRYIPRLGEGDIIAITSKIVSTCEGAAIKNDGSVNKHHLIKHEADSYLDVPLSHTYGVTVTIKDHKLVANAGIDESNGNGYFILWPRDPFRSATMIWEYLRKKYTLTHLGIIITDSQTIPLQWGTRGRAIAWCGIEPLKNYIGKPDIFDKKLRATKASIIDGLAAAAVTVMGEGNEQTPFAVIENIPFVTFPDRPPTKEEVDSLTIHPNDDIYAPLLTSVSWKKGKSIK
ncbi:coenzyme F420-0:L-glutamate ligase [Candidatus Gottesmanbacteria bacterium]|nr:coenzyme F420-0:L-glutamate ligase [Candidatus Gottesmanbacteria bacterium]